MNPNSRDVVPSQPMKDVHVPTQPEPSASTTPSPTFASAPEAPQSFDALTKKRRDPAIIAFAALLVAVACLDIVILPYVVFKSIAKTESDTPIESVTETPKGVTIEGGSGIGTDTTPVETESKSFSNADDSLTCEVTLPKGSDIEIVRADLFEDGEQAYAVVVVRNNGSSAVAVEGNFTYYDVQGKAVEGLVDWDVCSLLPAGEEAFLHSWRWMTGELPFHVTSVSCAMEIKDPWADEGTWLQVDEVSRTATSLELNVTNNSQVPLYPWVYVWGASEDNCTYQIDYLADDKSREVPLQPGDSCTFTFEYYPSNVGQFGYVPFDDCYLIYYASGFTVD